MSAAKGRKDNNIQYILKNQIFEFYLKIFSNIQYSKISKLKKMYLTLKPHTSTTQNNNRSGCILHLSLPPLAVLVDFLPVLQFFCSIHYILVQFIV